jgi:hypothetical protein
MIFTDDVYPDELQVSSLIAAVTSSNHIGSEVGKNVFAYAMTCEPVGQGAADSLISQFKAINLTCRAYALTVPHTMIFFDVAACNFSSRRIGLHRLRVACRSPLFDTNTIVAQSPCRLSRMPDEQEELRKEFAVLGIHFTYHTTMPATSMAELDRYYKPNSPSGFLR